MTVKDTQQVAAIHINEIKGFLPSLGQSFLAMFYRSSLNLGDVFSYVSIKAGKVTGFVTCCESSKGLTLKIFRQNISGFLFFFVKFFLMHPEKLVQFIKTLLYPGFSHNDPELLAMAVDRNFQGKGIGKLLFEKANAEFSRRGYPNFKISCYAFLPSNRFYRKIGCKITGKFNFLGEKMNLYEYGKEKLKIMLLTYDSLYANPVFAPVFSISCAEVVCIVVSDCIQLGKSNFQALIYLLRRQGLKYFLFKAFDQFLYTLSGIFKFLPTVSSRIINRAINMDIPVLKITDINSKKSVSILRKYKPDVLISYFNQVLKKDALHIAKHNLNVHPGYLPKYRGVASSLYARLYGKGFGGVTVHEMLEKLDSGRIFARSKVYFKKNESLHNHNFRCLKEGGKILKKTVEDINKNRLKGKEQKGESSYYSWPKPETVDSYIQKGYKLFSLRDLIMYFG